MLKSWFNYKIIDIQETFEWFLWGEALMLSLIIIIVISKMKQLLVTIYKKI